MNITRRNRSGRKLGWLTLAGVAALSLGGCKEQSNTGNTVSGGGGSGEILIGEYSSMTGTQASFGQNTHRGVTMAIDEANAAGGVLGKQVRDQLEDTSSRADQSVTAVQKLINQDHVTAIIGEVASSNSMAAAPICQQAKVPMISPASTNPKVTEFGDYIFRTCFIDPFQGTVCARFARNKLKAKTAAIFMDNKSDYSKGLSKFFKEAFVKSGGKIVAEQQYAQGDQDFRGQLTIINGQNPDVLFIPGYYTEVGGIARQARQLGIKAKFLGGDGWHSPELTKIGKDAVQGAYFSTHFSPQSKDPRVVVFVEEFKKRNNGQEPEAMAALAYDATRILLEAIKRAGGTDHAKIRDEIARTKNFPGVTGEITIDAKRNAVKPAVILQVSGNDFKYIETVKP
jgi:branched-chain amino acid transport system substrate-binding protein